MVLKELLKKYTALGALVGLALVAAVLSFFKPLEKLDFRLYDFMLGISKEIKQDPDIVFLDIDDESLAKVGTWPWTRDIIGDAVIRLKEFGAKQLVFDIEYVSPASNSVESNIADVVNENFMSGQQAIAQSVLGYAAQIQSGAIPAGNAVGVAENLVGAISNDVLYEMQRDISSSVSRDNDDYFARALQFFGNVSLTINMRNIGISRNEEDVEYAQSRFLFDNVSDPNNFFEGDNEYSAKEEGENVQQDFVPAINKIISRANGAGFTNIVIDKDGIRRRVELFNKHGDKYVGQLAFAPFMKICDAQSFERKKNSLLVKGALLPGQTERCDIKIPLDAHGRMLINWLHKPYMDSFAHVPAYMVYNLDRAEQLVLTQIADAAALNTDAVNAEDAEYIAEGCGYFLQEYEKILNKKDRLLIKCRGYDIEGNALRGGLKEDDYTEYFGMRSEFFSGLQEFVKSFETISGWEQIEQVAALSKSVSSYLHDVELIGETFKDGFVFIGNSASSSTDLGSTPFIKRYANLGTHANVANTILNRDFITELPAIWGIVICFVIAFFVLVATMNTSTGHKNIFGLIYVVLPFAIFVVMMVGFKVFIPPLVPFLFVSLFPYILEIVFNFRSLNAQRKFLQTKMGAYVSPEVVKEMQKNPQLAELGAQNRYMTALFSDVATFSGFTETLNNALGEEQGAVKLQQILSDYLGYLTKAIMGQSGTVDKFVGDEIVSFFNAPLEDEQHAFHACVAGIRMLQAEAEYNKTHEAELPINAQTGKPFLLHSRVGMNTGYMAVGNMGTQDKMNYTVMGNAVNLASRLEGTNKVYGSWIMCSDSTWQAADVGENKDKLVARKFDCVRVINVKKPVQIHNILGLRDELPKEQIEAAEIFNSGMDLYLKGSETPDVPKDIEDLKKALALYKQAQRAFPQDASSKFFIERCEDFIKNGLPPVWDGVFTMKTK